MNDEGVMGHMGAFFAALGGVRAATGTCERGGPEGPVSGGLVSLNTGVYR